MFGKLVKHEFAATWRVMLLLEVILLGAGIAGFFFLSIYSAQMENNNRRDVLSFAGTYSLISFVLFFVIALVTVNIIARVYLIVRYYKNLYTAEGYLTFTLPATTSEVLNAKILVGTLWNFLTVALTFGAAILTVSSLLLTSSEFSELVNVPSNLLSDLSLEETGILTLLVVTYLIRALTSLFVYCFCITVGQLWAKHKIFGAILCYAAVAVLNQLFTFLLGVGSGYTSALFFGFSYTRDSLMRSYQRTLVGSLVYTILVAALYYAGCILITRKRVNLD